MPRKYVPSSPRCNRLRSRSNMADEPAKKEEKTFLQKAGGVIIDFADWLGEAIA